MQVSPLVRSFAILANLPTNSTVVLKLVRYIDYRMSKSQVRIQRKRRFIIHYTYIVRPDTLVSTGFLLTFDHTQRRYAAMRRSYRENNIALCDARQHSASIRIDKLTTKRCRRRETIWVHSPVAGKLTAASRSKGYTTQGLTARGLQGWKMETTLSRNAASCNAVTGICESMSDAALGKTLAREKRPGGGGSNCWTGCGCSWGTSRCSACGGE